MKKQAADMDGPQFLVIGGMKCGSTSLYNDLATQPNVYLAEKELNLLSSDTFTVDSARRIYRTVFAPASPRQLRGDVSTTYAKLPDVPDVAERARQTLGPNLKIVYIVREPVSRCVSQHFHMHAWRGAGHMPADIDRSVREFPSLVNYSRYARQLAPWRQHFGDHAIHVILFEEFVADRRATMQSLATFLAFEPETSLVDSEAVANRGDNKPVLNKFWMSVYQHSAYQVTLRRLIPSTLRSELRKFLLPKAPPRPQPPSLDTVERILSEVSADERMLREFLRRDRPLWDFDTVRAKYAHAEATTV